MGSAGSQRGGGGAGAESGRPEPDRTRSRSISTAALGLPTTASPATARAASCGSLVTWKTRCPSGRFGQRGLTLLVSRVIDQDVQAAQALDHAGDEFAAERLVPQVARQEQAPSALSLDEPGHLAGVGLPGGPGNRSRGSCNRISSPPRVVLSRGSSCPNPPGPPRSRHLLGWACGVILAGRSHPGYQRARSRPECGRRGGGSDRHAPRPSRRENRWSGNPPARSSGTR